MRRILALGALVLALIAVPAFAVDVAADISYATRFIGASGVLAHGDDVIQGNLKLLGENGPYAALFVSQSPDGSANNNTGDEIDYTLGYKREFGKLVTDFFYSYYNIYDLGNTQGDLQAARLTLGYGMGYLLVEHDFPKDKVIRPGGTFYRLGAAKEVVKNISLDLSALGHGDFLGVRAQTVSSVRLGLTHSISEMVKLRLNYQRHVDKNVSEGGLSDDLVWATLTYSFGGKL